MVKVKLLLAAMLLFVATVVYPQSRTFIVRIENVSTATTLQPSDGSMQPVPLSPGVWAVHDTAGPLFTSGEPDRELGLEAIAEDGKPGDLAANLSGQSGVLSSALFNTPDGAGAPGPLTPGNAYQFMVEAAPGANLSFATMFVPSNDLFFGPDENGIPLFDGDGNPTFGNVTSQLQLWDAGTEANEEPGVGPNQVQRQSGPDTGPADPDSTVRLVNDGFTYPAPDEIIRVTIIPMVTAPFTVRIENVSTDSTLMPSDGSKQPVPLSPGVWAVHNAFAPLFRSGQEDRGDGLEAIAEDGMPGMLADTLQTQSGILASDLFNTPVGASSPGPLTPGAAYEFSFEANLGSYLSFATMFVPSNDLFFGPDENGIPLFDEDGNARNNEDVTMYLQLWDAGTEANEEPGVGPNQVQRQMGPDTGPADPDSTVRLVNDGFTYPGKEQIIRVIINPAQGQNEVTLTFGEGSDSDISGVTTDAYLDAHKEDINTGATTFLRVGNDGILASGRRANRTLLKFDFIDGLASAGVTEGSQITDAWIIFNVYSSEGADSEGITADVYEVLRNWQEGESDYTPAAAGEVTWNSAQHGLERWSVAGADGSGSDRSGDAVASVSVDSPGRVRVNVLASVQSIFDSGENNGWLLRGREEAKDKYYRIFSSEHAMSAARPKLVVSANVPGAAIAKGNGPAHDAGNAPEGFGLAQNYPNPFNPETAIRYTLRQAGPVKLTIYNTLGQRIRELVNTEQNAGNHEVSWNGRDSRGLPVSSGVYIYRLETSGLSQVRKMSLLK